MKIFIAILILIFCITGAYAGNMFFFVGSSGGAPGQTGKILLVDGASFILQTDGTSKICLAGGC